MSAHGGTYLGRDHHRLLAVFAIEGDGGLLEHAVADDAARDAAQLGTAPPRTLRRPKAPSRGEGKTPGSAVARTDRQGARAQWLADLAEIRGVGETGVRAGDARCVAREEGLTTNGLKCAPLTLPNTVIST